MHELSVTKSLISLILNKCNEKNIKPKVIITELGSLTSYKKDPILFNYDLLKKEEDLLKNTNLEVIEIKGKVLCNNCEKESIIDDNIMIFCPKCDSHNVEVIQGGKFKLKEIIKR